jgi:type II secretory pathway pseudopilin PulG
VDIFIRIKRRRARRGSIFLDALVGVFVFGLGAAAFFGLMPQMSKSKEIARERSRALNMANRMVEQLRLLKGSDVNFNTLSQLNLIDGGQNGGKWTFTNIPLDQGTGHTPAQSLRNGQGTLEVQHLSDGTAIIKVEVAWTSASGKPAQIATGTAIGGFR